MNGPKKTQSKTLAKTVPSKTVAVNRKARFSYSIEEEVEAGLVLTGTEVKSLRAGRVSIAEAYAAAKNEEMWLINAVVEPYGGGNRFNHEPRRPRKLLLQKRQIRKLLGRLKNKGVTLVPLTLYFNGRGIAKVKLGLAIGRKEYEKRDVIKQREWKKEQGRLLKK
jgi:SsrA-binding protein